MERGGERDREREGGVKGRSEGWARGGLEPWQGTGKEAEERKEDRAQGGEGAGLFRGRVGRVGVMKVGVV